MRPKRCNRYGSCQDINARNQTIAAVAGIGGGGSAGYKVGQSIDQGSSSKYDAAVAGKVSDVIAKIATDGQTTAYVVGLGPEAATQFAQKLYSELSAQ